MTDMKWKRLSFCGPRSWSEILAVGERWRTIRSSPFGLELWRSEFHYISFIRRCSGTKTPSNPEERYLGFCFDFFFFFLIFVYYFLASFLLFVVFVVVEKTTTGLMTFRHDDTTMKKHDCRATVKPYAYYLSPISHKVFHALHSSLSLPHVHTHTHSQEHTHTIPSCARRWMGCSPSTGAAPLVSLSLFLTTLLLTSF